MLLLLLFVKAAAFELPVPTVCARVVEFVEVLVPEKDRDSVIERWRMLLGGLLKNGVITHAQYKALKAEILKARELVMRLEAKGHKGDVVVGLANLHCSI